MKIKILFVAFLVGLMCSCEKEAILKEPDYQFVKRYCTMVTVGGVVGIAERCFEVGDVVAGYRRNDGTVTIRIAEHSPLNDGRPSSSTYQEFLDGPSEYLELRQ